MSPQIRYRFPKTMTVVVLAAGTVTAVSGVSLAQQQAKPRTNAPVASRTVTATDAVPGEPHHSRMSAQADGRSFGPLRDAGDRFEAAGGGEVLSIAKRADAPSVLSIGKAGRRLSLGRLSSTGLAAGPSVERVGARRDGRPNEVVLPDAMGLGADVKYEALRYGVKESVVLAAPPSAKRVQLRFSLDVEGLTARPTNDGGAEMLDKDGNVAFVLPPAFAFDSRGGAGTPGNAHVNVPMTIQGSAIDGYVLTLSPPTAWLTSPARVYPVTVDPTVLLRPWSPMNLGLMPFGNNSGGTSFSTLTSTMQFGNWWGSNWQSYVKFDPSELAGREITSVRLRLAISSCDNQADARRPYAHPIHIRRLTSAYWFGQQWGQRPASTGDVVVQPIGPNTYEVVDITELVRPWIADASQNFGLQLDMGGAPAYCRVDWYGWNGPTEIEMTYKAAPEFGLLTNFSFENGVWPWKACAQGSYVDWWILGTTTPSGRRAARMQVYPWYSPRRPGALCQDVTLAVKAGTRYRLLVSVHSVYGGTVSGAIRLFDHRTPNAITPYSASKEFTVSGPWWQNVELTVEGTQDWTTTLGVMIEVPADTGGILEFDYVVLSEEAPSPSTSSTTTATTSTTGSSTTTVPG